jgi:hypothetical protein
MDEGTVERELALRIFLHERDNKDKWKFELILYQPNSGHT